jgi:hypothetical protein
LVVDSAIGARFPQAVRLPPLFEFVAAPFYTLFPFATNVPYQLTKLSKIQTVVANFVAFDKGLEWLISAPGCSLSAPINLSLFTCSNPTCKTTIF